jgi:tetratricopeptide (TPR) repeat protein
MHYIKPFISIMRLLTCNERGELYLVERTGDNIPQYAILSHTWGDDEVTYNDLVEGSGRDKPSYSKIEFCVEQAARDGLQYSWVDTCCIDKWNLGELSIAINSMFVWYQKSVKCYVFLSDIPQANRDAILDNTTWEAAFRKNRWFTRGWTLQELIAPKSVEFFSSHHQRLGDKRSLEQQIHEITGIPADALSGRPLDSFSVEERMEWTKNRETKEEEDAAYCLLGIFGVQMPAIYGEGKANALSRLLREVKSTDTAPFIVPFDRNDRFTGRESQLIVLDEILFANGHNAVITGMGGIGKTQLALDLAYRTREKYKSCAVLWIPATNMESLHQGYVHIAQRLSIPGWNDEKADVKRLVQLHLSQESAGQWLLIFDSADDVSMWTAESGSRTGVVDWMQYFPSSNQGRIVFTTRVTAIADKLGAQNIVEVPKMDQNIAQTLLQKCLTNRTLEEEQQEARQLLEELNYLPLAITLAGAYMNLNEKTTLREYLWLLATHTNKSIGLISKEVGDASISDIERQTLAATWLISFEHICTQNKLAADFLSFIACIKQRDIPLSLLPTSKSCKEDVVNMLADYSMIIRRPAGSAFDIHQLVHSATRNWLQREGQLIEWSERATGQLEAAFPHSDHWNRNKWRRLLPHANYVLKMGGIEEENTARAALMWKCGASLYYDGRYSEAEKLFVQVMEMSKTKLGANHLGTLISIGNLASTYRNQGRWEEAEKLEVQVMEMSKMKLGLDHPYTLTSMANLAETYRNQGRWEEAEKLFVQVVETFQTKLGPDHLDTLTSMANLASTYRNQGKWEEAEKLEVQVVETFQTKLGPDHPSTLTSMNNLAETYRNQGQWEEAEKLEVQVMEMSKTKLGPDHPYTLTSMNNLAETYRNQSRWEEAEKLEVQVMETFQTKLGADHPSTLTSMNNLAETYRNQSRWEEAEKLFVQVMETFQTKLGLEHPNTLTSMGNLASTYVNQGRWEEAEKLFVQVIETSKTKLGPDHPDTLTSMANLASTLWNQGRWEASEKLEVQVMETFQMKLGPDHPNTLTSMGNLASTYMNQGRWEEAEKLFVQVIETSKTKLGPDHPDTLRSMANLASTLWNQGQREESEKLEVQVMETFQTRLGPDHPNTLTSMNNLASAYMTQGRWEEAEKLFVRVMETRKTKLGPDHPSTLTSMNNLAHTWKGQGKHKEALILMEQCVETFSHTLGPRHPNTLIVLRNYNSWKGR